MTLHICAPEPDSMHLATRPCPNCQGDRVFLDALVPWYGVTSTCLNCGDEWAEWERLHRPFERDWRKRRMRQAWAAFYRFRGITR